LSKKDPKLRARIAQILNHTEVKKFLSVSAIPSSTLFNKIIFDKILEKIKEKGYEIS
jgi:hypothetical protein